MTLHAYARATQFQCISHVLARVRIVFATGPFHLTWTWNLLHCSTFVTCHTQSTSLYTFAISLVCLSFGYAIIASLPHRSPLFVCSFSLCVVLVAFTLLSMMCFIRRLLFATMATLITALRNINSSSPGFCRRRKELKNIAVGEFVCLFHRNCIWIIRKIRAKDYKWMKFHSVIKCWGEKENIHKLCTRVWRHHCCRRPCFNTFVLTAVDKTKTGANKQNTTNRRTHFVFVCRRVSLRISLFLVAAIADNVDRENNTKKCQALQLCASSTAFVVATKRSHSLSLERVLFTHFHCVHWPSVCSGDRKSAFFSNSRRQVQKKTFRRRHYRAAQTYSNLLSADDK